MQFHSRSVCEPSNNAHVGYVTKKIDFQKSKTTSTIFAINAAKNTDHCILREVIF